MCRGYSPRKKLIRTMPPYTDRPINRAMVVGCAVSATRKHLKLHEPRFCHAACRLSNQCRPSIHQPTVDEFRLPAEMSIALSRAHLHARMHVASCWRRVHHRDRNQVVGRPLPVYPDQRTYSESVRTSQMCDRRTCELIDKQRLPLPSGRYFIRGAATSFIPHAVNSHGCCAVEPVGEGKVK
jgi:hypothetical protein